MKRKISLMLMMFIVAAIISCKNADLSSDEAKFSYSIGYQIASNLKRQGLELDQKAFMQAFDDVLKDEKVKLNKMEMQQAMMNMRKKMMQAEMAKAKDSKEGVEYLEKNKAQNGVKVTASGLQYKVIKEGKGVNPKATDKVKVHYKGTLINGKEFDSSYKRKKPTEFPLNGVIAGWTEGIQLMKVGSKYEFTIPSKLAYGPNARPGIPANSVLVFEVELLEIVK